eukprot:TRINITY_DN2968_c1_g1::TRINITY_DN2968_c1_g1_i1::g.4154::m.4154 TRINITY_DN2968_c1_g1::TRINITY_DN2968_c1_g1_i1::g.4154  ORF type:complete len:380 (+),score=119.41,Chloroplast_duf/PF14476.1/0.13 TRINITY_DN2968_c1_g1_i1:67-1140(+)
MTVQDWQEQLEEELREVKRVEKKQEMQKYTPKAVVLDYLGRVRKQHLMLKMFMQEAVGEVVSRPGLVLCILANFMGSLMINIWLYYSGSIVCCDTLKKELCDDGDRSTPCYLYPPEDAQAPKCGILMDTYGADFECTAFPQDTYRDRLWMALIAGGILYPLDGLIYGMFKWSYSWRVPRSRWMKARDIKTLLLEQTFQLVIMYRRAMLKRKFGHVGADKIVLGDVTSIEHILLNRDDVGMSASWVEYAAFSLIFAFYCIVAFLIILYSTLLYANVREGAQNDVLLGFISSVTFTVGAIQSQAIIEDSFWSFIERIFELKEDVFEWEELWSESVHMDSIQENLRAGMERLVDYTQDAE